jgi:hypothetical protein
MSKFRRLDDSVLWPGALSKKIHSGFADEELEMICDSGLIGYDRKLPYKKGRALYWETESYGFGRCYREWLGLPYWAPLPINGDHGVCLQSTIREYDLNAKPRLHLASFKDRAQANSGDEGKRVLRIPHPWPLFRRRYGFNKREDAKGTLIFYTHSCPGIEVEHDFDGYFTALKKLPDEYHPLTVCMHRHDIGKGYHRTSRKYGIPIISVGYTGSQYFVERFYSMISNFNFATSSYGGSELFYCEEFGVKYFIMGKRPKHLNLSSDFYPVGEIVMRDAVGIAAESRKFDLFSQFPPESSADKSQFVTDVLGLDIDEAASRAELRRYLFQEYFRHAPEILLAMLYQFMPARLKNVLRRIRDQLRRVLKL